jgi:hypothetical protein
MEASYQFSVFSFRHGTHRSGHRPQSNYYFFGSFLTAGDSSLHMQPDSLHAGHFLGLQRVSTFSPHFSQVKTAICYPPELL